METILVVDDEKNYLLVMATLLTEQGYEVLTAESGEKALGLVKSAVMDLVLTDMKMPRMDGIELLSRVKQSQPDLPVIVMTAFGTVERAVEAMRKGAFDYITKPFRNEELMMTIRKALEMSRLVRENRELNLALRQRYGFGGIIGKSKLMLEIFRLVEKVANTRANVLVTGESGTGKELIAKAIHAKSRRAHYPFIAINCGAMPDSLLGSELFGHQKGAFTGAVQSRKGFLEVAAGGTLFLDEVGEISPKMQIDLLRVLEERKICRIGSSQPVDVDFRLISATRRDLAKAIDAGAFRQDFFYRINVIKIDIPPLRKRKSDIPLLIEHFLAKYSQETVKHVDRVTPEAQALLMAYDWPGNVRELENVIERAVVLSKTRSLGENAFGFLRASLDGRSPGGSLKAHEKAYIESVLSETGWNVTRAAAVLDINRVTLHKKIKRYNLKRED